MHRVMPSHRPCLRDILPLALIPLILTGCIVIPIPIGEGYVSKGQEVAGPGMMSLQAGVTTRQDVLARLGEPRLVWDEERIVVYDWDRVNMLLFWAMTGGANALTEVSTHHLLLIQFDAAGVVLRAERTTRPGDASFGAFLRSWART
jgi:hypothetical protein